jgi:hypothetical protein
MSSIKLEPFRSRYPKERDAIEKLETLLGGEHRSFTLDELASKVHPKSRAELAQILGEIVAVGLMNLVFEVRSPATKEPIKDFPSPADIPKEMIDESTNRRFVVSASDVRPIYAVA